jgi:hypothetical protein
MCRAVFFEFEWVYARVCWATVYPLLRRNNQLRRCDIETGQLTRYKLAQTTDHRPQLTCCGLLALLAPAPSYQLSGSRRKCWYCVS